ncbi:MAG: NUDIX domain-containing protein [Myxococcota bacterium]
MTYRYKYPRPALTVDAVVFGLDEGGLSVLLIERGAEPFKGAWAFPGGFVGIDEPLEEAVRRELQEETGIESVFLEQLYTFADPGRDPRTRTVSVAYYGLVNIRDHRIRAATDARDARWFRVSEVTSLAFDHDEILDLAVKRIRGKVRYQPIGFELLPRRFTLPELQHLYETILDTDLDKRNFRKKVLASKLLVELDETRKAGSGRPARLYRFNKRKYNELERQGYAFEW